MQSTLRISNVTYTVEKIIAKNGNTGATVLLANDGNKKVAIKLYFPVTEKEIKTITSLIKKEAEILDRLKDTNIVVGIYDFSVEGEYALVLEYLENDTLLNFANNIEKWKDLRTYDITRTFIHGIIRIITELHNRNIAHLDLKLENMMFDKNCLCKLIDFEHSVILGNVRIPFTNIGTQHYVAPEIIKGLSKREEVKFVERDDFVAKAADIFSAGVIIFCIHFGFFPFENACETDEIYNLIIMEEYEEFWKEMEKRRFIYAPDELKSLITGMIAYLPEVRLSIKEVARHPIATNITQEESITLSDYVYKLLKKYNNLNPT